MGIDDDENGNGGNILTSTMFFPPREHTIDDNDGNGGEHIDEHISRWVLMTKTTTETGGNVLTSTMFLPPKETYD